MYLLQDREIRIKILARFYKKYVAKQEYFANLALN